LLCWRIDDAWHRSVRLSLFPAPLPSILWDPESTAHPPPAPSITQVLGVTEGICRGWLYQKDGRLSRSICGQLRVVWELQQRGRMQLCSPHWEAAHGCREAAVTLCRRPCSLCWLSRRWGAKGSGRGGFFIRTANKSGSSYRANPWWETAGGMKAGDFCATVWKALWDSREKTVLLRFYFIPHQSAVKKPYKNCSMTWGQASSSR